MKKAGQWTPQRTVCRRGSSGRCAPAASGGKAVKTAARFNRTNRIKVDCIFRIVTDVRRLCTIQTDKKWPIVIKLAILTGITAIIIWSAIEFGPFLSNLAAHPDQMEKFLSAYGGISILMFIGLQVMQVIIAVVPGEFVEIAGGYVYGTLAGSFYSIIGIGLGSMITFYIARGFGLSLSQLFISKAQLERLGALLNGQKSKMTVFLLFLFPGVPKDALCYIGGLLPVNPLFFLTASIVARIPALIITCSIGSSLRDKNYVTAIVVTAVSILILIAAFLMKKQITRLFRRGQSKNGTKSRRLANVLPHNQHRQNDKV